MTVWRRRVSGILPARSTVCDSTHNAPLKDTIFKDIGFQLDTVLGDKWYNVALSMRYPSTLSVTPSLTSEKYVIASTVKKPIGEPKKFFILRWFQKKYTTVEVDILERNPYIINEQEKFIEVVK